jgi:hypothetical protein
MWLRNKPSSPKIATAGKTARWELSKLPSFLGGVKSGTSWLQTGLHEGSIPSVSTKQHLNKHAIFNNQIFHT